MTETKKKAEETKGDENKNSSVLRDDLEINNSDLVEKEEVFALSRAKLSLLKNLLGSIRVNSEKLLDLLATSTDIEEDDKISIGREEDDNLPGEDAAPDGENGRIVEGVFDGENMIGPDGKQYSVPANYASKSKLVEGDILKLTITPNGTFVYKQIGPIDRARVVGQLELNTNGNFIVEAGEKKWRILTASVTYFKGQHGDEVVILVPKVGESNWAAVENIVRRT